jgi:hypothetical protein
MGPAAQHTALSRLHERPFCFTGAVSGSLDNLFSAGPLTPAFTMPSYIDGVPDRSYTTTAPSTSRR